MVYFLGFLIGWGILAGFFYLLFAFVMKVWNCLDWPIAARVLYAIVFVICGIVMLTSWAED